MCRRLAARRAGCPATAAARRAWLADLARDPTPNRIRRFGQALVLAAELPPEIGHLHAHFLHTPASVARYAAMMRGLDWSVSAHAKDIWTTPEWEKREKLASAEWVVTCTEAGRRHLAALAPDAGQGRAVLSRARSRPLRAAAPRRADRSADGSDPARPVVLLSVGRAVEKKGYDDLLAALALLPPDLDWRFVHIGGGALAKRAEAAGRAGSVSTDASSGAARSRSRRCSPPIARPICSCSPPRSAGTATATACPTC